MSSVSQGERETKGIRGGKGENGENKRFIVRRTVVVCREAALRGKNSERERAVRGRCSVRTRTQPQQQQRQQQEQEEEEVERGGSEERNGEERI